MNLQELISNVRSGDLPPTGIFRRPQGVKVTTQIDGKTLEVPDVSTSLGSPESPQGGD